MCVLVKSAGVSMVTHNRFPNFAEKKVRFWDMSLAQTNRYPNKMVKVEPEPFLAVDISLCPAEANFWYEDPPQSRMGLLSPALILNEGFFPVFHRCWWGVTAVGRMRTSCGGPLSAGLRSLSLSLSASYSSSGALTRPKWGQAPS